MHSSILWQIWLNFMAQYLFFSALFQFPQFFGFLTFSAECHWRDLISRNAHLVHLNWYRISFIFEPPTQGSSDHCAWCSNHFKCFYLLGLQRYAWHSDGSICITIQTLQYDTYHDTWENPRRKHKWTVPPILMLFINTSPLWRHVFLRNN